MNRFLLGIGGLLAVIALILLVIGIVRWTSYSDARDYIQAAFWVWVSVIFLALFGIVL